MNKQVSEYPSGAKQSWSEANVQHYTPPPQRDYHSRYSKMHMAMLLAQKPITLVLMMINSYSYSTNDLVFN